MTYFGQNLTGSKNKFVQRQIAENLDVFDVFLSEMKYAVFRARFLTYLTAMLKTDDKKFMPEEGFH